MSKTLKAVLHCIWRSKWGNACAIALPVVAICFVVFSLWYDCLRESTDAEPFLPISLNSTIPPNVEAVDGLCLCVNQGHHEGTLFFVANVGKTPVKFDTRPFRLLMGFAAWVEDENGTRHPLKVWPICPEKENVPRKVDIVTLKPGDLFSQSAHVCHPLDEPMLELRLPAYKIRNFVLTFEYVPAPDAAKDLWHGQLTSNPFQFTKPQDDLQRRYRRHTYPDNIFQWHLSKIRGNPAKMRDNFRDDAGMRLLTLKHFCDLAGKWILREGQFDQVLQIAMSDESPLVRSHAAAYRQTWASLLVDVNEDVRRAALKGAADRKTYHPAAYPPARGIAPLAMLCFYTNRSEDRLLALDAFLRNYDANEINRRQYIDFIQKALLDDDPQVRKCAEGFWEMRSVTYGLEKWADGRDGQE